MPEALILEFTGVSEAEYAAVNKHLGIDMQTGQGDWPAGLLSHAAGEADDGTFIVVGGMVLAGGPGRVHDVAARRGARGRRRDRPAPGPLGAAGGLTTSRAPEHSRRVGLPR